MVLEREREVYQKNLPGLLQHKGKFVLIHGDDIIGIYDTLSLALTAGYERWLHEAFMVKEIVEKEPTYYFSRNIKPCPM
jgi:hypothetical protein